MHFLKSEQLKAIIENFKGEINSIKASLDYEVEQSAGLSSDTNSYPERTVVQQQQNSSATLIHLEKKYESLANALTKLITDEENYGYCLSCGDEIDYERLLSILTTDQCVSCKGRIETEKTHVVFY